jgi:PTH1 family peptidyl-tRNA hydrolase
MFFSKNQGIKWLVVFLGNPGPKYAQTRHNAGFMTADAVERKNGVRITRLRYRALTAESVMGADKVLLMKPQTFMNLSGESVAPAAKFFKIPPERIIVISDDVALPPGKIRVRTKGSAGGHNGLKSIIECLGSDEFPRIRIGVGSPPHPDYDMADWVLSSFKGKDASDVEKAVQDAAQAIEIYIKDGADAAMNKYN